MPDIDIDTDIGTEPPVRILYLAWLRERAGMAEERVVLPTGVQTVGALMDWLGGRDAASASSFAAPGAIRAAVNQVFAGPQGAIRPGDEIAFFPPITGG